MTLLELWFLFLGWWSLEKKTLSGILLINPIIADAFREEDRVSNVKKRTSGIYRMLVDSADSWPWWERGRGLHVYLFALFYLNFSKKCDLPVYKHLAFLQSKWIVSIWEKERDDNSAGIFFLLFYTSPRTSFSNATLFAVKRHLTWIGIAYIRQRPQHKPLPLTLSSTDCNVITPVLTFVKSNLIKRCEWLRMPSCVSTLATNEWSAQNLPVWPLKEQFSISR